MILLQQDWANHLSAWHLDWWHFLKVIQLNCLKKEWIPDLQPSSTVPLWSWHLTSVNFSYAQDLCMLAAFVCLARKFYTRIRGLKSLPSERVFLQIERWALLGNAVSVNVAKWLGLRLLSPHQLKYSAGSQDQCFPPDEKDTTVNDTVLQERNFQVLFLSLERAKSFKFLSRALHQKPLPFLVAWLLPRKSRKQWSSPFLFCLILYTAYCCAGKLGLGPPWWLCTVCLQHETEQWAQKRSSAPKTFLGLF